METPVKSCQTHQEAAILYLLLNLKQINKSIYKIWWKLLKIIVNNIE